VVWDQWSSDSADQSDSEINHDDSELRGGVDDEFDDEAENELSQAPPPFEYNVEEHFADAIKAEPAGQPEKPVSIC
jgi:hypothetical protein